MTDSQPKKAVVVANEQQFERLNLSELGLQTSDFEAVLQAAEELDEIDQHRVAEYGKNIASQTASYTDELLSLVSHKDLDETGQKLNQVVQVAQQLNTASLLNPKKSSGFLGGLFNKVKTAKQNFAQSFQDTKAQIDQLVQEVEISQGGLQQRVTTLENMFVGVQAEYKQLGVYIAAAQLKQEQLQQQIAQLSRAPADPQTTQQLYDLNHVANNLEKRMSDLQILQQSAMQTLPMIRMIQSNNLMLVDKFYAIKNITLPAWKNQISLAISLNEQKNSVQLANAIDDATNALLRRNAELLHQNSVDTARANQRSVIDVETLEHVQNTLIKTVNDVIEIQKQGLQKRAEASTRLRQLQHNLDHLVRDVSPQPKS